MAIKKNLSSADVEVLGDAEIRRRKATQGTCPSCFLKAKLTPMGVCQDCDDAVRPVGDQGKASEPEATSSTLRKFPYDDMQAQAAKINSEAPKNPNGQPRFQIKISGPKHSPAYLGSCAQHTAPEDPLSTTPHPAALGNLPINATPDDYEHYAAARGGRVVDGVMHVDLRTPEQRDPNHRSYLATPMLVSQKINYNPTPPNTTFSGSEADMNRQEKTTYFTNQQDFRANSGAVQELLEDSKARLTPEELAEHNLDHGGASTQQNHRDEKGVPWLSQPDSCPLCRAVEQVKTAEYEHDTGQHTRDVNPLCPKC